MESEPTRILRDDQWQRMLPHIIGDQRSRGQSGYDNRMFVEAVLWIVRAGERWRNLPPCYGKWNSVHRRFKRWSRQGVWARLFAAMASDTDFEYEIVDGMIVRARALRPGAKKVGLLITPPLANEVTKPVSCVSQRRPAS